MKPTTKTLFTHQSEFRTETIIRIDGHLYLLDANGGTLGASENRQNRPDPCTILTPAEACRLALSWGVDPDTAAAAIHDASDTERQRQRARSARRPHNR